MDELIKEKIQMIKKTLKIFSGILVTVNSDKEYEYPDVSKEFEYFKSIYYEQFPSKFEKLYAIKILDNYINNDLGYKFQITSEYDDDESKIFFWSNLVRLKVVEYFPPMNDDYWSIGWTGYDFDIREDEEFDETTKKFTLGLLEEIKLKFSKFKDEIDVQIMNSDYEDKKIQSQNPDRELNDSHKKEMDEIIKSLNTVDTGKKWSYCFKKEEDLNLFAEQLVRHFNNLKEINIDKPIINKSKCKTRFSKRLRTIYKDHSNKGNLSKDINFITLLKKSLSVYNGLSDDQILSCLQK